MMKIKVNQIKSKMKVHHHYKMILTVIQMMKIITKNQYLITITIMELHSSQMTL